MLNKIISFFGRLFKNRSGRVEVKRKLASIQVIDNIQPIEGADSIEVAQILGWQVVVRKGEYKNGEEIVYIEYDSVLPEKPVFEFMRDKKFRVKTVKLRKTLSQGLVFHKDEVLPAGTYSVGDDVTDIIGITKYERPEPKGGNGSFLQGKSAGTFPPFLSKTDELRVQGSPSLAKELLGEPYVITEKYDGTSASFVLYEGTYRMCSRNFEKKQDDLDNVYLEMSNKYNIKDALENLHSSMGLSSDEGIAIQGEIVGPKIQGNPLKLEKIDFFAFNLVVIRKNDNERVKTAEAVKALGGVGIKHVPVIEEGEKFEYTIDQLIEKAKRKYLLSGTEAEGIVIRHADNKLSKTRELRDNPLSFKVINNDFLLKEK